MLSKYLFRVVPGIIILFGLLYYFGFEGVVNTWKQYNCYWLIPAIGAIAISTILGSYNLYMLISKNSSLVFSSFFKVYWLSWAAGLLIPGQIGDMLSLSYWLHKKGLNWKTVSALSLIDKLITLLWTLLFASIGFFTVLSNQTYDSEKVELLITGAIILTCIICFIGVTFKKFYFLPLKKSLCKWKALIDRSRKVLLINFLLTPLKITLLSIAYLSVLNAAGVSIFFVWDVLLLVCLSSLISYIPISFNGIGTVELTGIAVFGTFGIEPEVILSVFLSLRLLVIVMAWTPCILCFQFIKMHVD